MSRTHAFTSDFEFFLNLMAELYAKQMDYTVETTFVDEICFKTFRFKCPEPESCRIGAEEHVIVFKQFGGIEGKLELDEDLSNVF